MILFHAKRDGTVTTTPNFVPQGSSMQDLVVVSEFDYAYCAIKLLPASGEYIEDVPCTPIPQKDFSTIFTAALPPKATVVAGSVDYQLIFTAADGATQTTLAGSFTVPRGVPVSTPGSVEELSVKTIGDLYAILSSLYVAYVGHEKDIYQSLTDIAALKKTVSSAGYVTIPVTEWEDGSPTIATFTLDGFGAGMTAMLIPADSNTQTAAREARLSAYPVAFPIDGDTQTVEIIRADADKAPEIPLRFAYLILKTDTAVAPTVAIIGVDAYGEGGGTASGVDEDAVKAIITKMLGNVANERQYSAANPPPYPVTLVNGKKGVVNLNAEDVGARPSTWMPTAAEVEADPANTAQTLVNDLARKTAQDLANYYTKDQTLTKDEINTLVSAIPKFKIEVVTSLPTSNISETTVYLVKSWADSSNLYTEYIRANGAWERLGTQTVDLTGYATEAWVNTLIAAYVKTADMEEYVAGLLKAYITKEEADKAYQPAGDYPTADEMDEAISNATKDLAPKSSIPTVPDKLPNPNPLTINGKTYDGSSPVEVTVEGGASVDIMYISPDGSDNNDGLTVNTPKLTVKACFMAGASRISAKRGVYRQAVDISPTGGVGDVAGRNIEIFPTDNDQKYATASHERQRIVFDTSDEIALSTFSAYNAIKSAPYTEDNYTFTRIFTNGSTDGRASVWLVSSDELTVCHKLAPVLTLEEVEATVGTFYWADGTLYVNADWTGVEKVYVSNEMYNQLQFKGLASVILREVEARLPQGYAVNIENIPHFELYECVAKFTGVKSTGLHPKNASGKMVKCYATRCFDGLSPSGYGHTVYLDCVAEYNRDDGLSHHNACTGTIIGGRYSYNGKCGIDPAYGATVDIYNVLCEGNGFDYNGGGIGYLYAADLLPASGIVQGAVLVGNKVGLSVGKSCTVVASNCVFADNDTDKSIHASANYSEYNITDGLVKSVNGVKPDSNGNVTIEVSGDAPVVDTNLLHSAINSDGSKYGDTNGDNTDGYGNGYRVGYRIGSSGAEKESSVNCCTGFIVCQPNDVFTMENFKNENTGYSVIYFFDSSFAKTNGNVPVESFISDGIATITIPATSTIAYMRITTGVITDDTVITKVSA